MDKAMPTEMGRFEFIEGSELFLDAQYMSAFVWLKQFTSKRNDFSLIV